RRSRFRRVRDRSSVENADPLTREAARLRTMRAPLARRARQGGAGGGLDPAVGVAREAFGGVAVHRIVGGPGPAAEARRLVVVEGLADFGGRRHHERTVLDDGLADGATLEQQ